MDQFFYPSLRHRLIVAVGVCLASCGPVVADEPVDPAAEATELKTERLKSMKRTADRYEFFTAGEKPVPLNRVSEPILRWTNPVRGAKDGCLFLWTENGGPAAILSLYPPFGGTGDRFDHELLSLSSQGLIARRGEVQVWTPGKSGVEFKLVPDSAPPAESAPRRLSQIRKLAANFSATVTVRDDRSQLRMLTTPIYRYGDSRGDAFDGAIFAFAQGTDPELLLLLEAREEGESREWKYALARLTIMALEARYAEHMVWSAPRLYREGDPKEPYFTIGNQPAD